ncbi:MAG: LEVG family PEP-CTERM protein [Coleofasciculus sp. B1-GNL1-01]|uniref:LEVG family PEP-CTERM protein n=1 Tax=Coleofasciculus sp. B1-GNL1-01 TaxID=3068484 RepID=UPI0033055532
MNTQKISTFFRHTGAIASLVAAATVATGFMAPSASAISLAQSIGKDVGETEILLYGENEQPLGCIDPTQCLTNLNDYWIDHIVSLEDETSGTLSRLFVDNLATENWYGEPDSLPFVHLKAGDAGTVPEGFWFRPSEREVTGQGEEQGRLEVGTYEFHFTKVIPELKIAYFDTESSGTTGVPDFGGVLDTDGVLDTGSNPIVPGANGNISYQIWKDVSFITLKLGQDSPVDGETGDGVDFDLEKEGIDIPEPTTTLGLGALGLMGALGLRKRNKNLS